MREIKFRGKSTTEFDDKKYGYMGIYYNQQNYVIYMKYQIVQA